MRVTGFGIYQRGTPYVLVVGSGDSASNLVSHFQGLGRDTCTVVGCIVPTSSSIPAAIENVPVVGCAGALRDYIFYNAVDIVVFACPLDSVPGVTELVASILELGIQIGILPEFYRQAGANLPAAHISTDHIFGAPMVLLASISPKRGYLVAKRLLDIILSAIGLLLLSPLLLLLALIIKWTSPDGPVFYPWRVLGTNHKPFVGYKFRTMVPDADRLKQELAHLNEMEGPVFKMQRDPRIIPVGHFLRKYSLDELPQLYSVLKGDMSLVGPRPPSREEADQYEFWQRRKLCVKPGITCLWQINGRNEIKSFDEWARLDLEYIEKASLWLDLKILGQTIPAVFRGKGAC